ncbi:histidine kinase [Agromyces bauzanensis]
MTIDDAAAAPAAHRASFWAGVAIVVLAWAPAVGAVVIVTIAGLSWEGPLRLVVTAGVYAPVAAIVVTRRHPAIALILGALAINSGWLALAVVARSLPALAAVEGVLEVALLWPRAAETAALAVLPWLLARHRGRVRRVGVWLGVATVAADVAISTIVAMGVPLPREVLWSTFFASLGLFAAGAAYLFGEWRRGAAREREALMWLGLGGILLVAGYAGVAARLPSPCDTLGDAAFVLAQGMLPTAILAVVLGGEALGTDRRLATGTLWAQSIAVAVSLYLVVLEAAAMLGLAPAIAGGLAAGALALAFSSVSRAVRARTERLYFGDVPDARDVLGRLGEHLADAEDPMSGVQGLAEGLRATWDLASVEIVPASGSGGAALAGSPAAERVRAELRAGGCTVGTVELTSDDPVSLRESVRPLLHEIAGLIAVAVLLSDINHDVAETRHRMLGVRREERRMLHRELHDELAPSLAGIGFGMAAAQRLIAGGSPGARPAVAALREQLAERTDDVRRLARTLLPAALDEGDLDAALRDLAQRFGADGMTVAVRAAGSDVLATRVQLAVYLLVAEAVLQHRLARAVARIEIDVGIDDERVTVRVGADGEAPAPAVAARMLEVIERRAGDVGGTVRVVRPDQGRQVLEAVIPR